MMFESAFLAVWFAGLAGYLRWQLMTHEFDDPAPVAVRDERHGPRGRDKASEAST